MKQNFYFLTCLYNEIEFTSFKSSGPGGQNVNKTNSAVSLRWRLMNSNAFNDEEKMLLLMKLKSQLTKEGDLLIRSNASRSQEENKSL